MLGLDFAGDVSGQYGALSVSKLTTLDGGLSIDLTGGFTLATGDTFDILAFGSLMGGFDGFRSTARPACEAHGFVDLRRRRASEGRYLRDVARPCRDARLGSKLAGLRHRAKSLPRQSVRPLSPLAKTLPRHGARPRRWAPPAPDQIPRSCRSAHPRRLRPRTSRRRRPSRSARNPEERYGRRSTIVTSQLPLAAWHEVIGDPTYADAILDRLVHNAHRIELTGESLRRTRGRQLKTA